MKSIEIFNGLICNVSGKYGAPMGRSNSFTQPFDWKTFEGRVFDRAVPLDSGGYDRGGAYWGFPNNLRVRYTKNGMWQFYRVGD